MTDPAAALAAIISARQHAKATTVKYPEWLEKLNKGVYSPRDGSTTEWGKFFTAMGEAEAALAVDVPPPPPPPPPLPPVWPPAGYKPPPTPSGLSTILWRGQLLPPAVKPPLAIMLTHGHPPAAQKMTRWMNAADEHGICVAIPDCRGTNGTWYPFDQGLAWLKQQAPGWLTKLNADPEQVYLIGFSAGAWMAEYAALEGSMRLAGIAPVSGWADPAWPRGRKSPCRFLSMMGDHDAYSWNATDAPTRDPGLKTAQEFAVLNGYPSAQPDPVTSGAVDWYVWGPDAKFGLIHGGHHFYPGDPAAAGTPDATFDATTLISKWIVGIS